MQRVTDAHLYAKVETVNHLIGFEGEVKYSTVGAVTLYSAYGATGVQRYVNELGGVSTLMSLGTKREAANFLDGMIQALRIVAQ